MDKTQQHIQATVRIRNLCPGERTLVYGHIHVSVRLYERKGPRAGQRYKQYRIYDEHGNELEYVAVSSVIMAARFLDETGDRALAMQKLKQWKRENNIYVRGDGRQKGRKQNGDKIVTERWWYAYL